MPLNWLLYSYLDEIEHLLPVSEDMFLKEKLSQNLRVEAKVMGLWSHIQKSDEIAELRRRNEIEAEKVRALQKLETKEKLKYCPHCGKPLP